MAAGDKGGAGSLPERRPNAGRLPWIVAIVFVSGWMFFLGVMVGRGTAPIHYDIQDLKKQLAHAKATLFESEVKRFRIPAETQEAPADLSFYDALKDSRKRPLVKREMSETPKKHEPQKIPELKKDAESQTQTVISMEKSVKDAGEKPAPTYSGMGISEKPLTLQVASLPSQKDARNLAENLKKRGYPAYHTEGVMIPGKGVWYRVRIGFFDSREEASTMLEKLKKERFQPIVVNRNSR